jgi:hypothetical protein
LAPDQRQLVCLWQFGALALGVHGGPLASPRQIDGKDAEMAP